MRRMNIKDGLKQMGGLVLGAILATGCLSSAPKSSTHWSVAACADSSLETAAQTKWEAARVGSVLVRAPYDQSRLTVLRADGSVAFDAYNDFAAQPAALLRGLVEDVMTRSGLFARVVPASSSARVPLTLEVDVVKFALDCRAPSRRVATTCVVVRLLRGHDIVSIATAEGEKDIDSQDFAQAFSTSATRALASALKKL